MPFFDDNLIGGKIMGNTIRSLLRLPEVIGRETTETSIKIDTSYHSCGGFAPNSS